MLFRGNILRPIKHRHFGGMFDGINPNFEILQKTSINRELLMKLTNVKKAAIEDYKPDARL